MRITKEPKPGMNEKQNNNNKTDHPVWDDDLSERDNPPPRLWSCLYILSVVFALIYTILYPAWPTFSGYTKGIFHWSSKKQFEKEVQKSKKIREDYYKTIQEESMDEIQESVWLYGFIHSAGGSLFYLCARCHGTLGEGKEGLFPNLTDEEWIHGGALLNIYKTIKQGQKAKMPRHIGKLSKEEIRQVTEYVYSFSHFDFDKKMAEKGEVVFQSEEAECYDCHGDEAEGDMEIGAPDLRNDIWLYGGSREKLLETISHGRTGIMPAWKKKLSDEEIKILTVFVKRMSLKN